MRFEKRILPVALLIATAFAGCLGNGGNSDVGDDNGAGADDGLAPGSRGPAEDALLSTVPMTAYLHDVSQPIEGITVQGSTLEQYRIPSFDDVLLDTWIVWPDVKGNVPIVLEVTPYYGGGPPVSNETHSFGTAGDTLVKRGYAYGISSVRGTGNSGGCFTIGGPSEALDTAAVVEFLAAQPRSNGKVGLMGVSYPGTTPQDVWVEAPPSLKTIVPIAGISDLYKYNFVNGVPIDLQGLGFNTYYWVLVGASPAGLGGGSQGADPVAVPGAVAGEACEEQADVQQGGATSAADGNKDEYWQVRDFHAELLGSWEKDRASVFYIHGLQDWNVKTHNMEDWLESVQDLDVPTKVWLGQWPHAWPDSGNINNPCDPGNACRDDWWNHTMVAWFDYFLKDIDTGILDAPSVQVQDDEGVWRHEQRWPDPDAEQLVLYPHLDGSLGLLEPGNGSVSYYDYQGDSGPRQADMGPDRVVFVSDPVGENLTITGLPTFEADVTSSGSRASLILTLAEANETWDWAFNFAALSLNHAKGLEEGQADITDVKQPISVRFFPQDDVIEQGSRIVLIASGDVILQNGEPGPGFIPISDGSTITIDLANARLTLPIDRTLAVEEEQPCTTTVSEDDVEPTVSCIRTTVVASSGSD